MRLGRTVNLLLQLHGNLANEPHRLHDRSRGFEAEDIVYDALLRLEQLRERGFSVGDRE